MNRFERQLIVTMVGLVAATACQARDLPASGTQLEPHVLAAVEAVVAEAGSDIKPTQPRRRQASRRAWSERDYIGNWNGVEGMMLHVARGPDGKLFVVNVWSLEEADRGTFDVSVDADGLRWTRNGETVAARPGTGAETGLKWLDGKKRCLVVTLGEGYCRD